MLHKKPSVKGRESSYQHCFEHTNSVTIHYYSEIFFHPIRIEWNSYGMISSNQPLFSFLCTSLKINLSNKDAPVPVYKFYLTIIRCNYPDRRIMREALENFTESIK